MRLTCPNCGAQYEVPDEVIPEAGRDVQCSNCGDTWFQHHPDYPASDEADEADTELPGWDSPSDYDEEDSEPEPETDAAVAPEAEEADVSTVDTDENREIDEGLKEDSESVSEDEPTSPQRRELDPSVADVLREEAEREENARSGAEGGLETQPDLGLDEHGDDSDQRNQQVASRMARLRGLPEGAGTEAEQAQPDPDPGSRRNLLPDIDEINSSLSSESSRAEFNQSVMDDAENSIAPSVKKGGFRRGFMIAVLLFLLLTLLYLLAPMIAQKVPALASAMSAYVDTVNGIRIWLNELVGGSK